MPEAICEGIHSHIVVPTLHIVSSNMVSYPDHIGEMKSGLGMRPIKIKREEEGGVVGCALCVDKE